MRADRQAIDRLIDAEIALRRRKMLDETSDVLDAYLDSGLCDVEIGDQVRTLIGADYDTTAASFAWMLLRAAGTTDVWAGLRAGADDVLSPIDQQRAPDTDATLTNLVFTGRVAREAIRLHPPGLVGARCRCRCCLGDHLNRRGALIVWSPYLAGRDPASWVEPWLFNPDRFAELTSEQKALSDQAWVPFGRGPHSCLGLPSRRWN